MTVASPLFLGVAAAAALVARAGRREILLLAASVGFAAASLPLPQFGALGLFVLVGYGLLYLPRRAAALATGAAGLVALFWYLKHGRPDGALMLGLSYVMFRALHVAVDRHDGAVTAAPPLHRYLGYVLFFPAFLAGPIQRYEQFAAQLEAPALPLAQAFRPAAARLSAGFFALVVLAGLAERLFALALTVDGPAGFALATLAFAAQLYFSFAGYTAVAIGAALLVGITLPENFNRPYAAANFLDLWSRWHISLSEWFKFYIFNPVLKALLQADPARAPFHAVLCFFLTFFAMGLWHGTTWAFVVYGLLLGGGVSVNKLWQIEMARRLGRKGYQALGARPWYALLARTAALTYFVLALVLIWADIAALRPTDIAIGAVLAAGGVGLMVAGAHPLGAVEAGWQRLAATPWAWALQIAAAILYLVWSDRPVPALIYEYF
jgi:D-alanyl-lipoteichoic acid acyltransferase DltB (MBOAT superfamily)